jgi:TnpA family transposase
VAIKRTPKFSPALKQIEESHLLATPGINQNKRPPSSSMLFTSVEKSKNNNVVEESDDPMMRLVVRTECFSLFCESD